ncbi:MAG TPA: NTP transferase domain-containing protein [Firmicutes bacterium]|nr:NTP transferase domain-containing protein [Bacillota bacterium]
MKAVIMAGGEGSRLRPLTCDRPKPMVPVMNRPLMEYSVELLKEHGLRDIKVTLQYQPEQIMEHFGDGHKFGVELHYFIEDHPLGTAGSVKNASGLDETFIVISGDALTDFNLSQAVEFHRLKGAAATLVLTAVNNPLEYGVVLIDNQGKIKRFLEKPGWSEVFSDTVNTGIYILEPEVLDLIAPEKVVDFSKNVFPEMLKRNMPLLGCVLDGFWCDIGDLREYCRAHRRVLQGKVKLKLNAAQLEQGIWAEKGVTVSPLARLAGPIYLGRGCSIEAGARVMEETVLGSYTLVGERATVKRGITWERACLGTGSALRGGVLCTAARLAPRAAVFEESVVGDHSMVQEGAVIKPGVKVWPAKSVESGVILQDSLIWGDKISRTIFGQDGIRGEVNRSLTPEMASRLGAVYGSLDSQQAVLVSSDRQPPSLMIKQALVSGLLSAGAAVLDAGELISPIARQAICLLKVQGGVHVSASEERGNNHNLRIRFWDQAGLPLTRSQERKIEQLYFREDFNRPPGGEVGEALRLPDLAQLYLQEILGNVSADKIARAGFRIASGYLSPYLQRLLASLWQSLRCTIISINHGETGRPGSYRQSRLQIRSKEVARLVRYNNASLGVIFDREGEQLLLFDETGRAIDGDLYTALWSLLAFREKQKGPVAIPINVSQAVEKLAQRYRGRVLRAKATPRSLMELGQREQQDQRRICSPAALSFDGVAALVYLLDFMAAHDLTLSGLLKEIPAIKILERETACPWAKKGRVMRRLVQESSRQKTEMIDGLKIYHPEGWALILPDPDRPSYHVYGEGYSEEISASLTDFYINRINALQREALEREHSAKPTGKR